MIGALLAADCACGVGRAFELNRLGTQRVNSDCQAIKAAPIALQAVTETGNHLAQIGQGAPPGGDRDTLVCNCRIQRGNCPLQPLVPITLH